MGAPCVSWVLDKGDLAGHNNPDWAPCRFAALLGHVAGFPDLGLLQGLRPIPGSSVDDEPARHRPGWAAGRATPRRFPRSPCPGRRGRRPAFPGSLATPTPQTFPVASPPTFGTGFGVDHHRWWSCTADRPTSTRLEPAARLRSFTHWFNCVYTFPSRLPDPDRLAVPTRPGVVGAAPTLRLRPQAQAAPSFKDLLRQANGGVLSPPPSTWRLVAHPNDTPERRRARHRGPPISACRCACNDLDRRVSSRERPERRRRVRGRPGGEIPATSNGSRAIWPHLRGATDAGDCDDSGALSAVQDISQRTVESHVDTSSRSSVWRRARRSSLGSSLQPSACGIGSRDPDGHGCGR